MVIIVINRKNGMFIVINILEKNTKKNYEKETRIRTYKYCT